jgi:hypothetical protein
LFRTWEFGYENEGTLELRNIVCSPGRGKYLDLEQHLSACLSPSPHKACMGDRREHPPPSSLVWTKVMACTKLHMLWK